MPSGSCHCGAVRFTVEGTPDKAIECNCSHCQRKGLLLWFVPRAALDVTAGDDALTEYTFNRHVIRHRFCRVCGCQPFAIGQSPDGEMAAINLRCVDGNHVETLERVPVDGRAF